MHQWRVNYGNPRKGDVMTIFVKAETAGEAKRLAQEIARRNGFNGRCGAIRMLKMEAA
jgi:hypothetical protein